MVQFLWDMPEGTTVDDLLSAGSVRLTPSNNISLEEFLTWLQSKHQLPVLHDGRVIGAVSDFYIKGSYVVGKFIALQDSYRSL